MIAGEFRSRKLVAPEGVDVRPTSDRLRETLFDILQPEIRGTIFVDAYAGSGAVGIEALSRGARHAVFIERDRAAVEVIKQNLAALKIGARARIVRGLAGNLLSTLEADIVFADPPYPKEREYRVVLDAMEARPPKLLILQHSIRFQPSLAPTRSVKQGENVLAFYRSWSALETGQTSTEPAAEPDCA